MLAGESAEIQVKVKYSLVELSGEVSLVIQNGETFLANSMEVVSQGEGTVTLKKSILVPQTNNIQIFTPLSVNGGTSATNIVDTRFFKVLQK